ncbi:hypothetical protein GGI05_007661, partial [Coemansia sp. RSA 2603]
MDIPGVQRKAGNGQTAESKRRELAQIASFFLKQHSAYDMIPVSFRLIVLDTKLLVTKALSTLVQN